MKRKFHLSLKLTNKEEKDFLQINKFKSLKEIDLNAIENKFPLAFQNKFTIIEELGKGFEAAVYKVQNKDTKQYFAAKYYYTNEDEKKQKIKNEYNILSSITHPNIILYNSLEIYGSCIFIILTEYFPSICFKTYIENFPNASLESQSIIFKQLYSCLKHLKQNYIVHCDFNINNILINPSSLEIKLIDFGCAELFTKNSIISPKGNPDFRIRTTKNFELIDFWGLILVVLSLIFKIKVNSKNGKEILRKIHRNEINELKIEREIYEFINFGIKEFVLI